MPHVFARGLRSSIALVTVSLLLAAKTGHAASYGPDTGNSSVTISWMPPTTNNDGSTLTNLAGYHIHYSRRPNNLWRKVRIPQAGVTRCQIDNLGAGIWYFAVTAYTSRGAESGLSKIGAHRIREE